MAIFWFENGDDLRALMSYRIILLPYFEDELSLFAVVNPGDPTRHPSIEKEERDRGGRQERHLTSRLISQSGRFALNFSPL